MKEMKLMLLVLLVAVAGCKSSDNSLTLLRAKEWQLKSMTENGKEVKNPQQIPTLYLAIVVRYMVLQDVIVSSELMKLGKKGK